MSDQIQHFLLVFDHDQGCLIETEGFGDDATKALRAYAATEAQYGDRPSIEIVLVGSDSLDTVKLTHANYFGRTESASGYLAGI